MRGHITKRCGCPREDWSRCRHSWRVVASAGSDPATGRARQHKITVRGSRREAERVLRRLLNRIEDGTVAESGREKVAAYLARWLDHVRSRVRPRTLARYRELLERHVIPRIGNLRLGQVRPLHIQQVVDSMLAEGLAPRTVLHAYRVLSSALRQAVRWQLLGINPAAAVQPPRPERPDLMIPDPGLLHQIMEAAKGSSLEGVVVLAVATGMRRGEILGLRWRDVDLDAGLVRVTASLDMEGGLPRWMAPKTPRGRRTIALPSFAAAWLRQRRREQTGRRLLLGTAWEDHDVVLDDGTGRAVDPDGVSAAFAAMVQRRGWPVRLHDLRHAYATTLLTQGIHPKIVSEALGHSSVAFTLDTYAHVLPSMGEQAAAAIEAAMDAASK